jgi:tetratricopeptide (TPR) repeat protein
MSVTQPSQTRLSKQAKPRGKQSQGKASGLSRLRRFAPLGLAVFGLVASTGCAELRARHAARKGNDLFREGNYQAAIAAYEESQQIFPEFPISALNHGLACRQLMDVGAANEQSQKAADCALAQFKRLKEIAPQDERGGQLYEQTLFDANRYEVLEKMYLAEFEKNPKSMLAVNALIQVYDRWGKWDEGFKWQLKRAELAPNDPDGHYSIGVLIFSRLLEFGGKSHAANYDPRPNAVNASVPPELLADLKPGQVPALFNVGDIVGPKRIELADLGLSHLERALEIRADYGEAMIYTGLLLRQKSLAYLGDPVTWESLIQRANQWATKAAAQTAQAVPPSGGAEAARPAASETHKDKE